MAFKYGYKIEKGAYAGDILPLTSNFPNKAGSYGYNYFGSFQDDTIVSDDHVVSEYFDPNTNLMIEITPQLYAHGVVGDVVKIASIPLYAGQGSAETKTGYITLYLECFTQLREWYVKVCVEDLNGNNPSGIVSSTSLSLNDSGDWASNHETHAYLALTGYESGGTKMLGMYINSSQWLLEPGMFTGKYRCHWLASGTVIRLNTILSTFGIDADGNGDPVEFDPELGEASEPEGYDQDDTGPGSYDDSSDSISDVPDPSYGILDAGFINVYKVSTGALTALGNDVFPQLSSVTDLVSGLQCVSDMLFNSRLIDYVLDVHIIPCNVPADANSTPVKVGGRTCSALGYPVSNSYVNVDLGSINIKEYFKSFADYSFTSSKLHLPFVGFVDMKPEFWNGGELHVKYKFNVADGSFMAYVYSTSSKSELKTSLVAEYAGQAAIHIPVTGASYASAISGLLASAGGTIASATTGNIAGVAAGVVSAAANSSPDINQSNGFNSSSGIMGSKKAYLQIERPAYSMSTHSVKEQGFPLNVTYTIGRMSGFTTATEIILDGIPCTEAEKEKIRNFFKTGVIIR